MSGDPRRLMARLSPQAKPIPVGEDRKTHKGPGKTIREALEAVGKYRPAQRLESGRVVPAELDGMQSFTRIERAHQTRGGMNPDAVTAADIAHALGLINDYLAREIFCLLWWPDGAARTIGEMSFYCHQVLMKEYSERSREYEISRLDLHIVETNAQRWKADDRRELRKAKDRCERAKKERWPSEFMIYPQLIEAVFDELSEPTQCDDCLGRGVIWNGTLVVVCEECKGNGNVAASERHRAKLVGVKWSSYQRNWKRVYEWLYRQCWYKEGYAALIMRRALLDDPSNMVDQALQVAAQKSRAKMPLDG